MTLSFCKVFHTIVQQGSFVKTAELLNMTSSAVSHAVKDAEKEIGFQLFFRTRTGIKLTESGREIYPAVLQLLNGEEALKQSIDRINGLEKGVVKVGIFNSVLSNWMPGIFKEFDKLYPGIQTVMYEGSYDEVINWIQMGVVDFGFLSTSCTTELYVEPLYKDPLICIVPKGFKTRRPGYITIDEMKDKKFVIQREGSDADVQSLFKKYNLKFHSDYHILDDTSIMTLIGCGKGISVMATLTAKGLESNLDVLHLDPEEYRVIGLSCINKKLLSPAARAFYDAIVNYVKQKYQGNLDK